MWYVQQMIGKPWWLVVSKCHVEAVVRECNCQNSNPWITSSWRDTPNFSIGSQIPMSLWLTIRWSALSWSRGWPWKGKARAPVEPGDSCSNRWSPWFTNGIGRYCWLEEQNWHSSPSIGQQETTRWPPMPLSSSPMRKDPRSHGGYLIQSCQSSQKELAGQCRWGKQKRLNRSCSCRFPRFAWDNRVSCCQGSR